MSLKHSNTNIISNKKFIDNLKKKFKINLVLNNNTLHQDNKSDGTIKNIKPFRNISKNKLTFYDEKICLNKQKEKNKDIGESSINIICTVPTFTNKENIYMIKTEKMNNNSSNEEIKKNVNNNTDQKAMNILDNDKIISCNNSHESSNKIEFENNINNHKYIKDIDDDKKENKRYGICFLCERTFPKSCLISSECKIHFFCQYCIKNYFKGLIKKNIENLKCPLMSCNHKFNLDKIKIIFDDNDYKVLQNIKDNNIYHKVSITEKSESKIRFYRKESVIEIGSKNELMEIMSDKKCFCPNCFTDIAFYKTTTHFYKCLNCNYKICKYCHKEYTSTHLISNEKDYCKVYCRSSYNSNKNCLKKFLKQLIFVIVTFVLSLLAAFFVPFHFWNNIMKNMNKYSKFFLSYFLSFIIAIIIIPFLIILFPYFPCFIAFLDK